MASQAIAASPSHAYNNSAHNANIAVAASPPISSNPSSSSSASASSISPALRQYFYLSDIAKPVQLKIKSVSGCLTDLAERMLFEQTPSCTTCGGLVSSDIPLQAELELYVSVSIWSRGAPIGLPAHTAYRAAQHTPANATTFSASSSSSINSLSASSDSNFNSSSSILSNSGAAGGGNGSGSLVSGNGSQLGGVCTVRWNSWLQFPVQYRDLDHASRFGITVWCVAHGTGVGVDSKQSPAAAAGSGGASAAGTKPQPAADGSCSCARSGPSSALRVKSRLFAVGGCSLPLFNKRGLLKLGRRKLYLTSGVDANSSTPATSAANATLKQQQNSLEKLEKLCREFDAREHTPSVSWLDKLAQKRITAMQKHTEPDLNAVLSSVGVAGASGANPGNIALTIEFPAFKHPIVYHQKTYNAPLAPIISEVEYRDRLFVLHDPEIFKTNPIENAFHKLARSNKGLDRDLKPNKKEREEMNAIISSPNKRLTMEAKELLWKFRFSLTDDQRAVTKFLRCVNWGDVSESKQALELLGEWGPIPIADALELLSASFTHEGVRAYAVKQLHTADQEELGNYLLQLVQALRYEQTVPSNLSDFLINRACQSMSLANFFYWFLSTEIHDAKKGQMYGLVLKGFMERVAEVTGGAELVEMLESQGRLIQQLIGLSEAAKLNKGRVEKKVERMRQLLQPDGEFKNLRSFSSAIRVPVRPEILVNGVIGEESTMFKSALTPLLVCFTSPPPSQGAPLEKYRTIFKSGDDLRQDQLIIQMINLMDTLLKKVKLDLQLTPYKVLATGPQHGFVEFVPHSHTLTSILDRYDKNIKSFLEQHNPKPQTLAKVLDTFVKSCAGYCVITYILGIGDRHLENVMLTTSGHLFHIDFSFIFGRDPKPFPPPMKFSKEMVEAMGGADSLQYQDFRKYCCLAFNILRQHANLILNLLSLMGDANIPDLSSDVEKNLLKVQEKFRLDLSDTEADGFILALIDQSVSALFPQVMERIHKWALYWR